MPLLENISDAAAVETLSAISGGKSSWQGIWK